MNNPLLDITLESLTSFLLIWGSFSVISFFVIYFGKVLPMSSKADTPWMRAFGTVDKRTAWIILETPILATVLYFYIAGSAELNASVFIVAAFIIHYINRALIFPFRIKVSGKRMPVLSMISSMAFYIINGFIIGHYFGSLTYYGWDWLTDPRFIIGMTLFITGFVINIQSDNILINLRKPGETGYKIPYGGCFKYVSTPNYFGEILEWVGFAIMAWCLPAFIYMMWVALPLLAQGIQAHKWYLEKFGDEYPKRKAVIPYLI